MVLHVIPKIALHPSPGGGECWYFIEDSRGKTGLHLIAVADGSLCPLPANCYGALAPESKQRHAMLLPY